MSKHMQGKRYKQENKNKKNTRSIKQTKNTRNTRNTSISSNNFNLEENVNFSDFNRKNINENKRDYRRKNKKKQQKHKILYIILIILIIIFIYSLVTIIRWVIYNISSKKINEEIRNTVVQEISEIENPEQTDNNFNKIDFVKLKEINQDVIGYIEIPNTGISYPILQAKDNEYYLKKDIYKKYNSCGSIFMDYTNNPNFTDDNTVIFGHNLLNGTMFAELNDIYDGRIGEKIDINIYIENYSFRYSAFSIYKSEPVKEPIQTRFQNKEKFIEERIEKSRINFNIYPNSEDGILTLSTCDNTGKDRIILHAVKTLEQIVE